MEFTLAKNLVYAKAIAMLDGDLPPEERLMSDPNLQSSSTNGSLLAWMATSRQVRYFSSLRLRSQPASKRNLVVWRSPAETDEWRGVRPVLVW